MSFQPSIEDYRKAGLDINKYSPTTFIRLLSFLYKDKMWLDDHRIFAALGIQLMPMFFRTDEWDHEDDKPSQHRFFRLIVNALEKNDASLIQIENTNTHWRYWGTKIEEGDY
ncbi:DUF7003 family protein [Laceyella putida]|uniref:DUF7003 family protein n=1 Tax=Laceyella putida TaxID=110101 RepID=A0ABW2RLX9_9BACL